MDPSINYRIGIVGGYSFRGTSYFSNTLIRRFQRFGKVFPTIITVTNPIDTYIESQFISGKINQHAFNESMRKTINILKGIGCDFLVLPCNSLQGLFNDICKETSIDYMSPLQALEGCDLPQSTKPYGILCTSQLIQYKRFHKSFVEQMNTLFDIPQKDQNNIDNIILNIISEGVISKFIPILNEIVIRFFPRVDKWIIACSELSMLTPALRRENPQIEFIDTIELLVNIVFDRINVKHV